MTEYELDDELNKVVERTGIIRTEQHCSIFTAATRALREADIHWINAMYEMYDLDLDTLSDYIAHEWLGRQQEV